MMQRLLIHIVDRSTRHRAEQSRLIFSLGHHAEVYSDLEEFIAAAPSDGVLIARDEQDGSGMRGILDGLARRGIWLPVIATDDAPRTGRIVEAIKAGALDYLPLPLEQSRLASVFHRIHDEAREYCEARRRMVEARSRIERLSGREREVLDWLAEGSSNKIIARELEISPRTVEIHRANMMNKIGARHSAEAVRVRIEAQL